MDDEEERDFQQMLRGQGVAVKKARLQQIEEDIYYRNLQIRDVEDEIYKLNSDICSVPCGTKTTKKSHVVHFCCFSNGP